MQAHNANVDTSMPCYCVSGVCMANGMPVHGALIPLLDSQAGRLDHGGAAQGVGAGNG